MSLAIDLAGVIGTWTAVLLAIVALAGVLPAYFLYQRSRSNRARALASVDDPDTSFVSHHTLVPGIPLSHAVRVPDLRDAPRLQVPNLLVQPSSTKLTARESTTCWINLVHVMRSVFLQVRDLPTGDVLHLEDGQSHLPVHCLWVLLLGVVHRYAIRQDRGLPLEVGTQIPLGPAEQNHTLSGLSGTLRARTDRYQVNLSFETHSFSIIDQAVRCTCISPQTLVYLFHGYIKLGDGLYMTTLDERRRFAPRARAGNKFLQRARLARLERAKVRPESARVLRGLGLDVPTTEVLVLQDLRRDRRSQEHVTPTTLRAKGYHEIGDFKPRYEPKHNVWMERKDIQRIVLSYLGVGTSAAGFLYNSLEDIIVVNVLKAEDLRPTMDLAKSVVPYLECDDSAKLRLQTAINAVTDADMLGISWSRHAMLAFHALVKALDTMHSTENFMWEATMVLFAYDTDFRTALKESLEHAHGAVGRVITSDVENNQISIPGSSDLHEARHISFWFDSTFGDIRPARRENSGRISLAYAALAALQGHLCAISWHMCLSPDGLLNLLRGALPDGVCLFSSSPTAGTWHSSQWESLQESRGSSPTRSDSSRSSSSENSPESSLRRDFPTTNRIGDVYRDASSDGGKDFHTAFGAPLVAAAYHGHLDVVRHLLESGADVNVRAGQYGNALNAASLQGHADVVQLLLEKGADPSV